MTAAVTMTLDESAIWSVRVENDGRVVFEADDWDALRVVGEALSIAAETAADEA